MGGAAYSSDRKMRWLSSETIEFVARLSGHAGDGCVLEVASFYNMYDLKPVGRSQNHGVHKPAVCFVWWSLRLREYLQEEAWRIGFNETTAGWSNSP